MADTEPKVVRNEAANRYELWMGDMLAGQAEYKLTEAGTAFVHTEVDDAFSGQGLGSILARRSLEDAASRDEVIVPYCPFIQAYLKRHHDLDAHVQWPTPKHQRG